MIKQILILLFSTLISITYGQNQNDSLKNISQADSIKPHSVKLATILSACVPGAGQVYNHIAMPKGKKKAFWKVPLIYGTLGTAGYFAFQANKEQKDLKNAYIDYTENHIMSDKYPGYDGQALLQLYRGKLTQRDLLFLGMGIIYILNVVDAAVEAHFVKFDVSENLTLSVRPSFVGGMGAGVGLTLSFK